MAKNVLGRELELCCSDPATGWYRDGYCQLGRNDGGLHLVCAVMTDEFLSFTRKRGNDLSTPRPEFGFPGLKAGDGWCLCVSRWKEAVDAGVAPPLKLEASHVSTLEHVDLDVLKAHAIERKD